MLYFHITHIHRYWTVYWYIWGSSYVIKKIDILMSDGQNALKLPGDHIDFDLHLKINRRLCLMLKKSIYT